METVAIIGTGIVGKSWAMVFASGGHQVRLYDSFPDALEKAPTEIYAKIKALDLEGKLYCDIVNAEEQCNLIKVEPNLKEALRGATYIQECTPENLELKRNVFRDLQEALDAVDNKNAILGSSSSTLMASEFTNGLHIKERVLVTHPINPPYFMKLVEVVPSQYTDHKVVLRVRQLLESLGKKPVVMNKEIPGFAQNRIQYAIINQTWNLVKEGVLSAEDADTVMKEGLAPRYVFMGPLETAQLNAEGFADYCRKYGEGIYKISSELNHLPKLTAESAKDIDEELQKRVKNENLADRRKWRDENLANLAIFKNNLHV